MSESKTTPPTGPKLVDVELKAGKLSADKCRKARANAKKRPDDYYPQPAEPATD